MPKKLSEFDDSLEATNPDATIRIAGADGSSDVFVTVGTLVDRSIHTGEQTLDTIADAGALAAKNTAALSDIDPIAGQSILGNSAVSSAVPGQLTAAQARTLLNVADGATANASNADLRDRSTHTGTQPLYTIEGLTDALAAPIVDEITANALKLDIDGTIYDVDIGDADSGETGYRVLQVLNTTGTPSYGSFSITSGNIDVDENTSGIVVSVARSGGTSGANTVTWTVTAGLTTVATNTLSWGAGETGTKTFTLTAADIAGPSDASGTVSIAVTTGSASTGTNSVTMDVRYVAPETPGVMSISSTFPIGESGTTFDVLIDRSTGSDGAVAVDWTCTSGSHTTPLSGTETWIDGNSARKTVTLTRSTVSSNTYGTITLSNARRTDGGTTQPTISASATSTSFGITPSTSAGTISLVSTAIDEDENTPLPIVLTRAGGSAGAAVARWTITGDTGVDTATGTITWAAGEFGDKSPDTLPVAGFVTSDKTGGVLTVTIVSGSATLLAPVTGTIAVRNVPTTGEYTLQSVIARYPAPFAWSTPVTPATTPTIASTVSANTGNISSYLSGNQQKRVELTAGSYGDVTITGSDIELVLTTGVTIDKLRINAGTQRIKITAVPARSGTIGNIRISDDTIIGTANAAQDITIDGITQVYNPALTGGADSNGCIAQRLVVLNSTFTQRSFVWYCFSRSYTAGRATDWIMANNEFIDGGSGLGGSGDGQAAIRLQGTLRTVWVDNHINNDAAVDNYQSIRIHPEGSTWKSEWNYIAGNQIDGTEATAQSHTGGAAIENVFFVNNLQLHRYGTPFWIYTLQASWPISMRVTGNRLYSTNSTAYVGNSGGSPVTSVPSGWDWVCSPNTVTNGTLPARSWSFTKWQDFDPSAGEVPPLT